MRTYIVCQQFPHIYIYTPNHLYAYIYIYTYIHIYIYISAAVPKTVAFFEKALPVCHGRAQALFEPLDLAAKETPKGPYCRGLKESIRAIIRI